MKLALGFGFGHLFLLHLLSSTTAWNDLLHTLFYTLATIPTIPFSLEDIGLQGNYTSQTNPVYISKQDEQIIEPYVRGTAIIPPDQMQQLKTAVRRLVKKSDRKYLREAIQSYDSNTTRRTVSKRTVQTEEYVRNTALSECLKAYYGQRCQICGTNFAALHGIETDQLPSCVDTHHIQYLWKGGQDVSSNMIVVCPNHHRLIHATNAFFNRATLSYEYGGGISEKLVLTDHFETTIAGLE